MKIVLYSQRVEIVESYGERRDCADQRIPEFLESAGYLPVPVPNIGKEYIEKIIDEINPVGIVLTGGNSLVSYGGNAPERDETDSELISLAIKKNIPVYGFCRGMQSILHYFGNKLENVSGHVAVRHNVSGKYTICQVNSFHNQACVELNSNEIEVVLKSDDGVIEMIRHNQYKIIGTMWHPEREDPFSEDDIKRVNEIFG